MAESMDDNHENIIKEAVQQFIDAQLRGEEPDIEEFVRQYPDLEHQIRESIQDAQRIDALFNSLSRADESDFPAAGTDPDLVGRRIEGFEIEEMIGRGGMGVVYLGRDTKLDRSVAIKSMPVELRASSTAQARFRREARLLASLNHPNIAVIHEIIEQEKGAGYLVLEYVPGQTLAQRIDHKPLKLDEVLSIGQQLAEAVSAAHDKGVAHRDLKPGNIKITPEGKVKVLDFGLAKASSPYGESTETTVTQPGRIMGTPAYMSPEQARGKDTDHRTDIWSFGCIMYEMLTGNVPFEGETVTDTVAMILEREPDWQALPQDTPTNVQTLLRRCLEKDPCDRLRDIGDAAIEIRKSLTLTASATAPAPAKTGQYLPRWSPAIALIFALLAVFLAIVAPKLLRTAAPGHIKSLAVLPLENYSGDPNQEHYAAVITDDLISALGMIGALDMRSRTSVMQYKDARKSLSEIAQHLKVDGMVEGSVQRDGNQIRITVRLFHAPIDKQLWTSTYKRDVGDTFTLCREIARTIADEIEITVTPDQEARLAAKRPINPETFDTYVRGMYLLYKSTPEGTKKGLEYLQQAIENDPSDPLAYGQLALGYAAIAHGPGAPPDALEQTEKAALKALELDKTSVEAHAALGHIMLYRDWKWKAAEKNFQDALQLNPSLTLARSNYSWYLLLMGRVDEALAQMKRVQEVDPLTPLWPAYLGTQYLWVGRHEEAVEEIQKSLELDSDFAYALNALGSAYAAMGMYEEAVKANQKACEFGRQWKSGLALTYAMAGRINEARLVLDELEAEATTYDTWFIAQVHAVLGQNDEAFRWLEKACGPPKQPYVPWTKHCPAFKSLHDDPRFQDLLRRMNLLQ